MLTNDNNGGGGVKSMVTLVKGIEVRNRKTPIFETKFAFQGVTLLSLNYIKQFRLKDTLHWTPLFSKKKLHPHEYDIPLDRVGHL